MSVSAWRFTGSGWALEHPELPVDDATWTHAIQSPPEITVELGNQRPSMPALQQWRHALGIEVDGTLRAFGVITDQDSSDEQRTIHAVGLTGYPAGMPWTGKARRLYGVDPASVIRTIWNHLQGHRGGNVGLVVDKTATATRVGRKAPERLDPKTKEVIEQAVDEPFILDRSETHDLGAEIDKLAGEGELEWREDVRFTPDGLPSVRMRLSSRLGRRRSDAQCALGVNVVEVPDVEEEPTDWASDVLLIGAGEGPARIVSHATLPSHSRVRRVHVHQAQDVYRQPAADAEAAAVLAGFQPPQGTIKQLQLIDHPLCPVWGVEPGDELRLTGDAGQAGQIDRWVRVLAIESTLSRPHIRKLEVETP